MARAWGAPGGEREDEGERRAERDEQLDERRQVGLQVRDVLQRWARE